MSLNIINRTIYTRDNIDILRGINSECIDMIYLDPPFNTNKKWNAPLKSRASGAFFEDTWSYDDIKAEWVAAIRGEYPALHSFLGSMRMWASEADVSYITYMSIRMLECHRILKDTGTLWYHCDPTMNDYIKVMLDIIFGRGNNINSIVWCYHRFSSSGKKFVDTTDNLFWYKKGKNYTFNTLRQPLSETQEYRLKLGYNSGKRQLQVYDKNTEKAKIKIKEFEDKNIPIVYVDIKGKPEKNWWEIPVENKMSKNYVGYPTQKPLRLLHRIIKVSTNEGDFVLDPFCGCATTCVAAEQLNRQWVGIDMSNEASRLVDIRINGEVSGKMDFKDPNRIEIFAENEPPVRTDSGISIERKYVYVISNPQWEGEYKVGIAADVKSRLSAYNTSDPNASYKVEYKLLTSHYREIENATHDHFPNKREWVQEDLNTIIDYIIAKQKELE